MNGSGDYLELRHAAAFIAIALSIAALTAAASSIQRTTADRALAPKPALVRSTDGGMP